MKPHFQLVDEVLKANFSKDLLEAPPAEADSWSVKTSNAQPAILAATYITYQLFKDLHGIDLVKDPRTKYLLGHSLGEYTALVLADVIDFKKAIGVVRTRGLLMEELCEKNEYSMLVLVFRPKHFDVIQEVANKHKVLACVNTSSQILISGTSQQLDAALAEMPKDAVSKVAKLPVKIPFHNEILQTIEPELVSLVQESKSPIKPIVCNYSGNEGSGDHFSLTVQDNSKPVLWKQSLDFMVQNGVDTIVNLGPGRALAGMNKRKDLNNHSLVNLEEMTALAEVWNTI